MTSAPAPAEHPEAPLFSDGLGDRVVAADAATGDLLQILRLRPQLLAVPSFEFALRERAARLANFRHAYYARVRRIDRHPAGLAIVSDHIEGTRLSDILRVAAERRLTLDLNAALCLIRQLVPSVALLHENARDVAHGLLAPERLVITPHARVVIVEHVLGSAVEQLQYSRDRLWQDLRVALPATAGAPRFDHRADVIATGLVALALVLGRPIRSEEFPQAVPTLLHEARARSAMGEEQPLPAALRLWLARMLQIDARNGFATASEAQSALEDVLAEDLGFVAAPVALETFLSRYIASLLEPAPAAPSPMPVPAIDFEAFMERPVAAESARFEPAPTKIEPPVAPPAALREPAFAPEPIAPQVVAPPVNPIPLATLHQPAPEPPRIEPPAPRAQAEPPRGFDPQPRPVESLPRAVEPAAHAPEPVARAAEPAPRAPAAPPSVQAAPPAAQVTAPDITELLRSIETSNARDAERDALFAPEPAQPAEAARDAGGGRSAMLRRAAVILLVVGALSGGGWAASRMYKKPAAPTTGTLSVQTNPPGVAVFVDGVAHGNTPARISLSAGSHLVELRGRGVPRVVPVTITAGTEASQYLELPETPSTGSLLVQSDPPGAKVSVDGAPHGAAPVSIADLAPGDHEVVLQADGSPAVKQHVVIQAGVTSSVLAPVATAQGGPVSGWVSFKAPFTIEVREGGRLIGTTDTDRIMLASGRHELQLTNDTLGYKATKVVQVPPGKMAAVAIDLPQGTINLNASPWAEVWIDGKRVGETPIGNLPIAIGPHEVVFRNPQLGEKHQAVSVTLAAPVRLSVSMK